MHRRFRELLHSAEGHSRRVVVVFLDVRDFSSFAGIEESTDTAEFLKSVYLKILDDYFPEAAFFKPTGDGLLLVFDYDRDNLQEELTAAAERSIRLVEEFPHLCDDDPMVNFEVPGRIGVGLARGSATCLMAEGKVLDYSGRPLNLASRLMDLARPAGIVIEGTFGYELLPEAIQRRFSKESVYVKGLAEENPIGVYSLKGTTDIPAHHRFPINRFKRHTQPLEKLTFDQLQKRIPRYLHPLEQKPARIDTIKVHLSYPIVDTNGEEHPSVWQYVEVPAEYAQLVGMIAASTDYSKAIKAMKKAGVDTSWQLAIAVEYDVLDDHDNGEKGSR